MRIRNRQPPDERCSPLLFAAGKRIRLFLSKIALTFFFLFATIILDRKAHKSSGCRIYSAEIGLGKSETREPDTVSTVVGKDAHMRYSCIALHPDERAMRYFLFWVTSEKPLLPGQRIFCPSAAQRSPRNTQSIPSGLVACSVAKTLAGRQHCFFCGSL